MGSQNQAPLAAYALKRSHKQRNQLALSNLPLVKKLARRESATEPCSAGCGPSSIRPCCRDR